ncbi:MAG: type VI secretion system membrane subunit TssM [Cellvibrionaceae bacterium]
MRRFFAFITQGWFLSLLGVILLSLIIWYIGPLIAIAEYKPLSSEVIRLISIFVVFIAWGLNNLRIKNSHKKADKKIAENLIKEPEDKKNKSVTRIKTPDEKILTEKLHSAIELLQGSRFGKQGKLYELPWYMIIGAPGTGKTTALKNSGLHFPLRSKIGDEPVQGVGGTRYCDWWFTDQAILIDTAGRYTTQDNPKKVENHAWFGFLSRLKKSRPKRPLNGIIVTISIQDIMQKTATQKSIQSTAIKQRIQELNSHLGMTLPVYVMFTKLDMVAGFNSFFTDLENDEREQVWGTTFPKTKIDKADTLLDTFSEEYVSLIKRLNNRVLLRLSNEKNPQRRTLVYEFPKQMFALQQSLNEFLGNIFTPNQFESPFLWRGVYFLSSTQTNMASQWVTGILPTDQCAPPIDVVTGEPKTYFVNHLLKNVIFGEANLASLNAKVKNRFRWIYTFALAATTAGFAGMLFAWNNSKELNNDYIESIDTQISHYKEASNGGLQEKHNWHSLAKSLNLLKDLPSGFDEGTDEHPFQQGFGLYQGKKLGSQTRLTYLKALEAFFMKDVSKMLTQQIANAQDDEQLYEALKFYLMLYYPEKMEQDNFTDWVNILWERQAVNVGTPELSQHLNTHLHNALSTPVAPYPINQEQVDEARQVLVSTPLDLRVYRRLKNDYMDEHSGQFSVTDVLGKKSDIIFYRRTGAPLSEGIPELFTYKGFHTGFNVANVKLSQRLADEEWIYGDAIAETLTEEKIKKISVSVNDYYFSEYSARWQQYLDDLLIKSFSTLNRGQAVARLLASSEQPLVKLLESIRKNTALSEAPKVNKALLSAADELSEEFAQNKKNRLERLVPKAATGSAIQLPGVEVTEDFEELNNYVNSSEGMPLEQLQLSLKALNEHFQTLAYAGNVKQAAFNASRDSQQGNDSVTAVKRAVSEAPIIVQRWFGSIARDTTNVTAAATQSHMNNVWQTDVVSFYEKALKDRYPLDPNSPRDVKLDDFTEYFGPGGILENYFNHYIEPFVDRSQTRWKWKKNIGLSNQSLALFEKSQRIQRAFFGASDEKPEVKFSLKPKELDPVASLFLLETNDATIQYGHGPISTSNVTWPNGESDQSKIVFNLVSKGTPVSARAEGEWSWFRLLEEHAKITEKTNSDSLLINFDISGLNASYELKPSSSHNPFNQNDLRGFSLPRRL